MLYFLALLIFSMRKLYALQHNNLDVFFGDDCRLHAPSWCSQFAQTHGIGSNVTAECMITIHSENLLRSFYVSGQALCFLDRKFKLPFPSSTISAFLYDDFSGILKQHQLNGIEVKSPSQCLDPRQPDAAWWVMGNDSQYPIGSYFNGEYYYIQPEYPYPAWKNMLFLGDSQSRTLFQAAVNIVSNHTNYYRGIDRLWCFHNWTEFQVGSTGKLKRIADDTYDGCWKGGIGYFSDSKNSTTALFHEVFGNAKLEHNHLGRFFKEYPPDQFVPDHIMFANGLHGINLDKKEMMKNTHKNINILRKTYPTAEIIVLGTWIHRIELKPNEWQYHSLPALNKAYYLSLQTNFTAHRFIDMAECTAPFYSSNVDGVHFRYDAMEFFMQFLWSSLKYHPCQPL